MQFFGPQVIHSPITASRRQFLMLALGTADELAWKAFLEWRASTYLLLAPPHKKMMMNSEECDAQMFLVSDRMWKSLKGFVKPGSSQAFSDLEDIVWNSMLLDLDFRKQLAHFEVKRTPRPNRSGLIQYFHMPYDSATMADSNSSIHGEDSQVEIIVSPALFRSHDWSEGACDGANVCILRAEVFRSSPSQTQSRTLSSLRPKSSKIDDKNRVSATVVQKPRRGLR